MKWLFLTVATVVAGAVGAFAIYTWGYRDSSDGASAERARAMAYSRQLAAAICTDRQDKGDCRVLDVDRAAPNIWETIIAVRGRPNACWAIDLQKFSLDPFRGIADLPCPRTG